jgi:hypothetical protein
MSSIKAVAVREIRAILPALIFFLLLFHLIAFSRAVILDDFSFVSLRASVATVGALIVAKSILIVDKLPIAGLFPGKLVLDALWKALLFGVVALLFRFIEELIHLTVKHQSLDAVATRLHDEVAWPEFWVFQLWLFGALFLFCLARELVRVAGAENVRAMLWGSTATGGHKS